MTPTFPSGPTESAPRCIGLLLAAGRGQRFDPSGRHNKLLQRLPGGDPVVLAGARNLLLAGLDTVIAVIPPNNGTLRCLLVNEGVRVLECLNANEGMAESLKAGLNAARPQRGWVVALGDMPFVLPETIREVMTVLLKSTGRRAVVPWHGEKRGNPVAFPLCWQARLQSLTGDEGARRLLHNDQTIRVAVPDNGILRDIDYPNDLLNATAG